MTHDPDSADEDDRLARRREQRRRYREANRETIQRYNADNRDRLLQQKRIAERNRVERIRKEKTARAQAVERARQWDAEHRDRVRERERRYREANREKLRERQREHYKNNKDKINARNAERQRTDPKYQQIQARYRDANREKIRERQRAYRANPDVYERALQYNREWRRRERRRINTGLPRTRSHHTPKAERAQNKAAADAFFTRAREADERRRIVAEFDQLRDEKARAQKIAQRRRTERAAIARERANRIVAYLERRGTRLREEVRMDSRARELRGADPYPDLEQETRRRAAVALTERSQRRVSRAGNDLHGTGERRRRPDPNTGPLAQPPGASGPYLGM
jgi:hypothetical protein